MTGIARLGMFGLVLMAGGAWGQAGLQNVNSELLVAARSGRVATVTALLEQGANPDSRNRIGDTPLNTAAKKGDAAIVKLMLERGADVNLQNASGVSPLMSAAYGGHADIVKLLLAHKADPTRVDRIMKTATIYAAGDRKSVV